MPFAAAPPALDAALACAAASSAASTYGLLAGAIVCAILLALVRQIAALPAMKHFGEFVGEAAVTWGLALLFLAGTGGLGAAFFLQWSGGSTGEAYFDVLASHGHGDRTLFAGMKKMMTPGVLSIHNEEARAFAESNGAIAFHEMHARIRDRVVADEAAGKLPLGSYGLNLFALEAGVVADEYAALLDSRPERKWKDTLAGFLTADAHDYRSGPNPRAQLGGARPAARHAPSTIDLRDWAQVADHVYPVLIRVDALTSAREGVDLPNEGLVAPWTPELSYYYAVMDGTRLMPLKREHFAGYGVAPEDFARRALENLGRRYDAEQRFDSYTFPTTGAKIFNATAGSNGLAASFVLIPDLYQRVQRHIDGPFVVIIPTDDSFIAGQLGTGNGMPGGNRGFNGEYLANLPTSIQAAIDAAPSRMLSSMTLLFHEGGMARYVHTPTALGEGAYPLGS